MAGGNELPFPGIIVMKSWLFVKISVLGFDGQRNWKSVYIMDILKIPNNIMYDVSLVALLPRMIMTNSWGW